MNNDRSIAIVGIGGIFPGARDLDQFWENILDCVDTADQVPPDRWAIDTDDAYDPQPGAADKVYSKKACLIDKSLLKLDTRGLAVSKEFIDRLDPLFHLLLIAGKQAFNDAGAENWDKTKIGVIIGNLVLPTDSSSALAEEILMRTFEEKVIPKAEKVGYKKTDPLNRYVAGLPAGILAKALRLGGDSFTIDAACASSLYAVKLAADELLAGRADAMLCGGVSRPDCLYTQMGFSQLRAVSANGSSAPFDIKGDGLVVGEGAGIFVLKRLSDAVADGDHIYGVIRGIGLSNDMGGRLLAPTSEGQLRAMRTAYEQAEWQPKQVDLIECHATGTPVGDAVEFESLKSLWEETSNLDKCIIGSVKSNIGHLLTAAGAAALMKVLLALKEKKLPPTANFSRSPSSLAMQDSPFEVLTTAKQWTKRDENTTRKAAVSAFGFGGINAHVLIEEWKAEVSEDSISAQPVDTDPPSIAVIGMDVHFGPWDSLKSFQHRVLGGTQAKPSAPGNWWGVEKSSWFKRQRLGKTPYKGFYIDKVTTEVDYFRIPPKELEEMLPQQLLMLQVATRAWNDAGLGSQGNTSTGVFIGIGLDMNTTNFHVRWLIQDRTAGWLKQLDHDLSDSELDTWTHALRDAVGPALTANRTMGGLGSVIASRVARELRLGGPSFTISSEETSGINALKTAVQNLQNETIDSALVGAVDMAGDIRAVLAAQATKRFSASGKIKPFDTEADGTIIGEGAAAVILKRLDDAIADEDRIYAVIKGIGTSTGGKTEDVITDTESYILAMERAYNEAGTNHSTVEYIDTYGSGCPEEDKVESAALLKFFGKNDRPSEHDKKLHGNQICALGSAKKDIGHTGSASALASVVKSCLCLYQEIIPPLDETEETRPQLQAGNCILYIPQKPQYWLHNRADGPRRAAVSSISITGNCAHVVLEAWEPKSAQLMGLALERAKLQPLGPGGEKLFSVTADNSPQLLESLEQLRNFIDKNTKASSPEAGELAQKWWKENHFRSQHKLAVSFICRNIGELYQQISYAHKSILNNPKKPIGHQTSALPQSYVNDRIFYNPKPLGLNKNKKTIAFVFPGSGNQFPDMGREIFLRWPEIPRKQYNENQFLRSQYRPDCFWNIDHSADDSAENIHNDHQAMIFGQVALGTGISDLMRYLGVRPEAAIGYSLGETASLFALGAWTDRDLMLERMNLSTLFTKDLAGEFKAARINWKLSQHEAVDWVLGVIDRPISTLKTALKNRKKVYALISNTLRECVIGGKRKVVEGIVKKLGCQYIPIKGVTLAHCEVLKEVENPYRELHLLKTTPPLDITFYSGSWGKAYTPTSATAADSILAHAIHGIDFPKTIKSAYKNGVRIFIEIGPGSSCTRMVDDILAKKAHLARSVCSPGQQPISLILRCLGHLISERVDLDLETLYGYNLPSLFKEKQRTRKSAPVIVQVGGSPFTVPAPMHAEQRPPEPEQLPQALTEPYLSSMLSEPPAVFQPERSMPVLVQSASSIITIPAVKTRADQPVISSTSPEELLEQIQHTEMARMQAHEKYLQFASDITKAMTENIAMQMAIIEKPEQYIKSIEKFPAVPAQEFKNIDNAEAANRTIALDIQQCMEFAIGSIGNVFGPDYDAIDSYPTRVRLPDEPLMLVDRVRSIEGKPQSLEPGRIITEHDVKSGVWYLDGGRMPICIAVEAGQADLMLAGFLGIDLKAKGIAKYRLLDADITFHRHLPVPGEVVRYDIRIKEFFIHNGTYFFHFEFDGTVNGTPLLMMRNGCAGFFTESELSKGQGLIKTHLNSGAAQGKRDPDWEDLTDMTVESYSEEQLQALRNGDLAACFGPSFEGLALKNPLSIPDGRMKLVDRVIKIDPKGGRFGLGIIEAEADIHPDDWFLTCHFIDDMVMPGTLMYECCMHTLRIFLLRMGWVCEKDEVSVEPVPGITSRLKCRGQVTKSTSTVTYEIAIKHLGYDPEPYAIADARIYADKKYIVDMENMSIKLTELSKERLSEIWQVKDHSSTSYGLRPAIFDNDKLLAFTNGNPSEAFGEPYRIFDRRRRIARLPGPPYKFLDRIVEVNGEPWKMAAGPTAETQYQVPTDGWYFDANRQDDMPFAILLETALQPCGWLAAYVGSALESDVDLCFRNLGGNAIQHKPVRRDAGILTTSVKLTNVSSSAGMILQQYEFQMRNASGIVYEGNTDFGFFSKEALAQQVGIQGAELFQPSEKESACSESFDYPHEPPFPDTRMRMNDDIDRYIPHGGTHGLGFIRATKIVDPDEWFFKAHFYQDPVNPGSLGLEAFIQLLKVIAAKRWSVSPSTRFTSNAVGHSHQWLYRGQVIPSNKKVIIEASVTSVDDQTKLLKADGYLSVDDRIIYRMIDFTLKMD